MKRIRRETYTGYVQREVIQLWERVYSLEYITEEYGIWLKTEYLKATTNPHKRSLECQITRLGG